MISRCSRVPRFFVEGGCIPYPKKTLVACGRLSPSACGIGVGACPGGPSNSCKSIAKLERHLASIGDTDDTARSRFDVVSDVRAIAFALGRQKQGLPLRRPTILSD
jgi:hypothetical protein